MGKIAKQCYSLFVENIIMAGPKTTIFTIGNVVVLICLKLTERRR